MRDISVRKSIPFEEFSMINTLKMCVYFNHIISQVFPDSFQGISTVERRSVSSGYKVRSFLICVGSIRVFSLIESNMNIQTVDLLTWQWIISFSILLYQNNYITHSVYACA